mmetsp:Transcript_53604/g.148650  ORF Transcript_53604/g.148650 Transcript_53604/m.148650 type:complete len:255 (-) Transcript_53604:509-1273(-)
MKRTRLAVPVWRRPLKMPSTCGSSEDWTPLLGTFLRWSLPWVCSASSCLCWRVAAVRLRLPGLPRCLSSRPQVARAGVRTLRCPTSSAPSVLCCSSCWWSFGRSPHLRFQRSRHAQGPRTRPRRRPRSRSRRTRPTRARRTRTPMQSPALTQRLRWREGKGQPKRLSKLSRPARCQGEAPPSFEKVRSGRRQLLPRGLRQCSPTRTGRSCRGRCRLLPGRRPGRCPHLPAHRRGWRRHPPRNPQSRCPLLQAHH